MNKAKYLEYAALTLNTLPLLSLIKLRTAIFMYNIYIYIKRSVCAKRSNDSTKERTWSRRYRFHRLIDCRDVVNNILVQGQCSCMSTASPKSWLMYNIYSRNMLPCILDHFAYANNNTTNNNTLIMYFYDTRRCDKMLFLKQTRKRKQQMTISYHGVNLWNSFDANIKDCWND